MRTKDGSPCRAACALVASPRPIIHQSRVYPRLAYLMRKSARADLRGSLRSLARQDDGTWIGLNGTCSSIAAGRSYQGMQKPWQEGQPLILISRRGCHIQAGQADQD